MGNLLADYQVFSSTNPDKVIERISSNYCEHSMRVTSNVRSMNTTFNRISFGSTAFNFLTYGAPVEIAADAFEDFIMLEFPVEGCSQVRYGGQSVASKGDNAVVVSAGHRPSSRWDSNTSRLMVQIDYRLIERQLSELLDHGINKKVEFLLMLDTSSYMGKGLRDYAFYVVEQLTHNSYLQKNRLVRQEMERNLVSLLLCGQPSNLSEQINARVVPGQPRYIKAAYDYIKENHREDISMEDLLKVSGVSSRALYAGFRRYLGTSPMMALKARRLKSIREYLLQGGGDKSITEIAGIYGFVHMGNFSKDYFRQFGEKPSETLRKAR